MPSEIVVAGCPLSLHAVSNFEFIDICSTSRIYEYRIRRYSLLDSKRVAGDDVSEFSTLPFGNARAQAMNVLLIVYFDDFDNIKIRTTKTHMIAKRNTDCHCVCQTVRFYARSRRRLFSIFFSFFGYSSIHLKDEESN